MQRILHSMLLFSLLAIAGQSASADPFDDAIQSFQKANESANFFQHAFGYAIFPTVGKGGVVGIGGAHGKGRVYSQGVPVGSTTLTQISVGPQLGGQAYSLIVFFEDQRALNEFTTGNFEFSAEATAVAITAGVSAKANTGGGVSAGASGGRNNATQVHGGYRKGMAIFSIARGGLMYEASVAGQKFSYTPL